MKKALFFDADGTLIDIEQGMTESTRDALLSLVQKGHQVFLCTGRSRAFVPECIARLPLTGMICSMGAYLELNGKNVFCKEVPLDIARKSVEILRDCNMIPVLEGAEYMYYDLDEYTTEIDWYADLITQQLGMRHRPISGNEHRLHFSKISAKQTDQSETAKACSLLEEHFDYIYHEGAFVGKTVEMIAKGCTKGIGVAVLCGVLGIDKRDAIAFGDSNNDLDMFHACGYRVAMGDASDKLKSHADYVTAERGAEGIEQALKHLKLL